MYSIEQLLYDKVGQYRLSRAGFRKRDMYTNSYTLYSAAVHFMLAGHISVEEFKPVNTTDFMRYLSSCKKKIFAGVFDEQSNKSADGIMELFEPVR